MSTLLFVLFLVVIGGLVGSHVGYRFDHRIKKKIWESGGHRQYVAGVAAAIVGVTFLSGPVDPDYTAIATMGDGDTIGSFVKEVLKLLAVAVLAGYLGTYLLRTVADRLLNEETARRTSENSVYTKLHVSKNLIFERREYRDALAQLDAALAERNRFPEHLNSSLMSQIYLLRAYALKRLKRIDEALHEVKKSLDHQKSAQGYYNKACYIVLKRGSEIVKNKTEIDEVADLLEKAVALVLDQEGTDEVAEQLRRDVMDDCREGGDLYEVRDQDAIKASLSRLIHEPDNRIDTK